MTEGIQTYEPFLINGSFEVYIRNMEFRYYQKYLEDRRVCVYTSMIDDHHYVHVADPRPEVFDSSRFKTVEELEIAVIYHSLRPLTGD